MSVSKEVPHDQGQALINPVFETDTDPDRYSLLDFDHLRITAEKDIPNPPPVITIGGAAVGAIGNITAISAAAKAGKTAVAGVLLAGSISTDGYIDGFPDLKIEPNVNKKAVVHLDTEQSEPDQQYMVKTVLKRAGLRSTPDHYRAYNIMSLSLDNYQQVTSEICEACNREYDGIHLILIDGGADFIASVNDESASTRIVQFFRHLSQRYSCPVVVIVHQNPGSDKERGHFGSEIQRRCYGLLTITREGDISTLQAKMLRKAGNGDVPLIHFTYSKEKGYHIPTEVANPDELKNEAKINQHKQTALKVFPGQTSLTYTETWQAIMKVTGKESRTAKQRITDWLGWGLIEKGPDDRLRCKLVQLH